MKKNKNIPIHEPDRQELEYVCPSASWGDMTGLIPANPTDKETRDSYQDIYPYLPTDRM